MESGRGRGRGRPKKVPLVALGSSAGARVQTEEARPTIAAITPIHIMDDMRTNVMVSTTNPKTVAQRLHLSEGLSPSSEGEKP